MVELNVKREDLKQKAPKKQKQKKYKKRRLSFSTIFLSVALLVGTVLIAYPTAADWWNSVNAYHAISDYTALIEDMSAEDLDAMFEAAEAYNAGLSNGTDFELSDAEMAEYMGLLSISESGIMGYIEIPSINVNLPVYHTVEEDVLQTAAGHIPGTSLPVGGERTHAAISGHRGLPSAKLFTDLNKLGEGDVFMIHILDRTFTYQIDQVRIVLPEETSDLAIQPGRDYVTLVTCTPYGVNSHRMLVRGSRIENLNNGVRIDPDAVKVPGYLMIPFLAAPMLGLAFIIMLISGRMAGPKKSKNKMLKDLQKNGIDTDNNKK